MHPTDGALLAMLDNGVDSGEQRRLQRHLDGCEHCRRQIAGLGRRRLVVDALLQELEVPVPARFVEPIVRRATRRRSRRRELIAAATGLFIVSAASATLRSGVLHDVVRRFTSSPAPAGAPAPHPAPPAGDALTGVALEATDDVLIEFAAAQSTGELRVVLTADPRVSVNASEPVPYALGSGKVAVVNEGARASYRVTLPRGLERAAISVAGRVIFAKSQSTIVTDGIREGTDSFRLPLTLRKVER